MQSQVITVPQPPAPPAPGAAVAAQPGEAVVVTTAQLGSSPRATYLALREKREVIGEQMSRVLDRRSRVTQQIAQAPEGSATRSALEQHLTELNGRITDFEKQLHAADAEVAAAAGVPGAMVPERQPNSSGPDEDALGFAVVFVSIGVMLVFFSWARRLWKGAGKVVTQIPAALEARFTRFEQSIDAMSIEIERISEGQRFLTRVLSDQGQRAVGAGPAQPIETRAEMPEAVRGG